MANPNETYNLPQLIGAALMTGRLEFIDMAIAEMKTGKLKLEPATVIELVRLLRDTIDDREKFKREKAGLEKKLKNMLSGASGLASSIDKLLQDLRNPVQTEAADDAG